MFEVESLRINIISIPHLSKNKSNSLLQFCLYFHSLPAEYGDRAVFWTLHGPRDPWHRHTAVIQGILWARRSSESHNIKHYFPFPHFILH